MIERNYSFIDKLIDHVDQGLRAITGSMPQALRSNPAKDISDKPMSDKEKRRVASLMRVNHSGEVCAQALYQGQALVARSRTIQEKLTQSAIEEIDHLHWCQQRIHELGGHVSYLNPLWHFGSLSIGIIAGVAGDKWNLGFLAETENQVVKHINNHLIRLPSQDEKSQKILEQMREDEQRHATTAITYGGVELPKPIKIMMQLSSKVMTTLAYKI